MEDELQRVKKENNGLRRYILTLTPYCDNCEFEDEDSPCDECHRKQFYWKHKSNIKI